MLYQFTGKPLDGLGGFYSWTRSAKKGWVSQSPSGKFIDLRMGRDILEDVHWSGDKSWMSVN